MTTGNDGSTEPSAKAGSVERIRRVIVNAVSYILPLLISAPNFYVGLMTMPLFIYLVVMVTDFVYFPALLLTLFLGGGLVEIALTLLGLGLLFYSVLFLHRSERERLVTTGPYGIVRHPQYLGLLMFTASLTNRSVWILQHTFGFGYLTPEMTLAIWFPMMLAYIGLALFEEHHLRGLFPEAWLDYRRNIGFLIPRITFAQRWVEVVVTFALLSGLMLSLFLLSGRLYPFI